MKMATQTKRLVSEVVKLRAARARDLARYQEHLSQKVRALEANKVTIADMNLELKQLRDSYDAKREHANALAAELARHVEARKAAGRPHPKGTRIDSPKNWALLNQRDEQWISSLQQLVWSAQNLMEKGPVPPAAGIYREVPDPADGNTKLERIIKEPDPQKAAEAMRRFHVNYSNEIRRMQDEMVQKLAELDKRRKTARKVKRK